MQLLKVAVLQATITVQFWINCTATTRLRVVIITHYNACYVIINDNGICQCDPDKLANPFLVHDVATRDS